MLIWLAWACLGISYEEASTHPRWSEFLDESLGLLEARTGSKFAEGYNQDIEVIRLTLDPVVVRLMVAMCV